MRSSSIPQVYHYTRPSPHPHPSSHRLPTRKKSPHRRTSCLHPSSHPTRPVHPPARRRPHRRRSPIRSSPLCHPSLFSPCRTRPDNAPTPPRPNPDPRPCPHRLRRLGHPTSAVSRGRRKGTCWRSGRKVAPSDVVRRRVPWGSRGGLLMMMMMMRWRCVARGSVVYACRSVLFFPAGFEVSVRIEVGFVKKVKTHLCDPRTQETPHEELEPLEFRLQHHQPKRRPGVHVRRQLFYRGNLLRRPFCRAFVSFFVFRFAVLSLSLASRHFRQSQSQKRTIDGQRRSGLPAPVLAPLRAPLARLGRGGVPGRRARRPRRASGVAGRVGRGRWRWGCCCSGGRRGAGRRRLCRRRA